MSLCGATGKQCVCQPDEGVRCPYGSTSVIVWGPNTCPSCGMEIPTGGPFTHTCDAGGLLPAVQHSEDTK